MKPIVIFLTAFALSSTPLWAYEQIVRPFQSPRSMSMGGVRITNGFYEENFYGNPARTSFNPEKRVQLFDLMAETTPDTIDTVKTLSGGGGDTISKVASTAGQNSHGRIQTSFPGFYWVAGGKWHYAAAFLTSGQFDLALRNAYRIEPQTVLDMGPHIAASRKYLKDDRLAVGATMHFAYRLSTQQGYSFVDLIKGASLSPQQSGGEGAHIDFSLGGTYELPLEYEGWKSRVAGTVNNIFGGRYQNIKVYWTGASGNPIEQPRSYGLGFSVEKEALGVFTKNIVAIEFTDIGNNPNGSLFRTLHIGAETQWWRLIPRFGINQGYWTAGLGTKFGFFQFELGSYGEELTLNVGGKEDRRYFLRLGFIY